MVLEPDRLWTLRAKLMTGALRREGRHETWFGKGSGRRCDGCDRLILSVDVQVELDFADGAALRFHAACLDAWRAETAADSGAAENLARPSGAAPSS
jgi:hypothetical protein